MTEARSRGQDPPAASMTMPLYSSSEEEEEEEEAVVTTSSPVQEEDDDESSESECESECESESEPEVAPDDTKPKRVSYSKDLLKSTKEGSKIQAGQDLQAASESKVHTPDYIHKQLKATGFGDKVKKGEAVPRDHVPQPVDPNAKLGEMYKSVSMKSTGFGDKLKRGQDVPRDQASTTTTKTTTPAYATVALKKTGNPEEKKKKAESKKSPTLLTTVKLQKAEPIVKETKPSSIKFPEVKLQKTAPIIKEPKKFELPQEFSAAKDNLKRRTERPWYSNGVPAAKSSKKWFFQRGEWSDTTEPNRSPSQSGSGKSWFFGSATKHGASPTSHQGDTTNVYRGSKTKILTGKDKVNVQHFNELGESTKKNPVKKVYNKQYYEDIQRRRKGLPPKATRRFRVFWRILFWVLLVPLLLVSTVYYGSLVYPDEAETAWKRVQPHVDPIMEQVHPHVVALKEHVDPIIEQVHPRVVAVIEQVRPHVDTIMQHCQSHLAFAVDRVCSTVEDMDVPVDKKWAEPVLASGVSWCSTVRAKLGPNEKNVLDDVHTISTGRESQKATANEKTVRSNVGSPDGCECSPKGPKWKRILPGGNRDRSPECCDG